ncbi:UNVERIFIED_ORG: AAA family ATPase [Roseateles sp. XES5]|nr:AAA family ATPase [Roseateles sp. XES5]
MNYAVTYGPKVLSDFRHFDQKLAAISYVGGNNTRPLLLYGPAGTGKTAFARILAENLCADVSQHDILFINGSMENSIDTVREKIATFASVTKFNEKQLSIIIIDEADGFSGSAQNALKAEIDRLMPYTLFILTTNHLEKLAGPIRDRCKLVHCPWPMPSELLPLAQTILAAEGDAISDEKLLQVLGADYAYIRGLSYRQMFQRLEELVVLRRMRAVGSNPAEDAKLS